MCPSKPQLEETLHVQHSKRDFVKDREGSRRRGVERGRASRWALHSLPPIEEDEP